MKAYVRYFLGKLGWFAVTLVLAFILNFVLPRLMPGDPVAVMVARIAQSMSNPGDMTLVYQQYAKEFGTDKPVVMQFFLYINNLLHGNMGVSFSQYPRTVADIIRSATVWTLALQIPAIMVGWTIGNILGALAAYLRKGFDHVLLPLFIFINNLPAFGLGVILLTIFALGLHWFPVAGGYGYDLIPSFRWAFIWSIFLHYQLPFWTVVLVSIGGEAVGMRSMSIYELNADYVRYARFLGIGDRRIVGYVFRNALLPQVTGLAMAIGGMMGGNLIAEIIFSYPGLGMALVESVTWQDYPLISASTLIVTLMMLTANFMIEIAYGLIDPRIKTAQAE